MANPWEMNWTSAAPGGLAPRTGTFIPKAPDPYKAKDEGRKDEDQAIQRRNQALAEEKNRRDQLEWNATHNPDGSPKPKGGGIDPALQGQIDALGLDEVLTAVERARKIIAQGGATGLRGQVGQAFWGSNANALKGQLSTIGGNVTLDKLKALKEASSTGASGLGSLTEREGEMLRNSVAAISQEQDPTSLLEGLAQVEKHVRSLKAIRDGNDPADPKVAQKYGLTVENAPAEAGLGLTTGRTQTVPDPTLKGANAHVAALIRNGRGDEVPGYLESLQPGLSHNPGIVSALPKWISFMKKNPGYTGNIGVNIETKDIPVGAVQNVVNQAGQSALGAGILGVADTVTAGSLDNLTSNPALARAGMSGVQQEHPGAYLAGQVGGQAMLGALGEGALVARGMGAGRAALTADALSGAAYGAGSNDDGSRLAGAGFGGLAGVLGNRAGAGMSRIVAGVTDPSVGYLAREDVRLTPGQMLGGMAKSLEDRAAGFWGIGDLIRNQRRRGIEDFNRAAFREAVEPVNGVMGDQIGEGGVNQAHQIVDQAYDVLNGRNVTVDPIFGADLQNAVTAARRIPRVGDEVADSLGEIIPPYFTPNGNTVGLTGENLRPMLQELRQFRTGYRNDPLGSRVANQVVNAEDAIQGLFHRQAPDVIPQLNAANRAYGRIATIDDAVLAARNSAAQQAEGGVFMPSQLINASVAGTKRFGGKRAAAEGRRPFNELGEAGQAVLPSSIPDSGTAGRLALLPGALALSGGTGGYASGGDVESASAGTLAGGTLGLALASPYLARGAMQRVLVAPRTPAETVLADYMRRTRLPGSLAVPLLAAPSADGM